MSTLDKEALLKGTDKSYHGETLPFTTVFKLII